MKSRVVKPVLAIMFLVSLVCSSDSEASVDISVTKAVSNAAPKEGEVITYTITVENVGDSTPWSKVSIVDYLPEEGLTDISFDSGGSIDFQGNIVWSLEPIAPGENNARQLTITATVNGNADDTITNRAKLGGVLPPGIGKGSFLDPVWRGGRFDRRNSSRSLAGRPGDGLL